MYNSSARCARTWKITFRPTEPFPISMPSPKYPLRPLLDHRERKVDAATVELGGAIRGRESADRAREAAEVVRRDAEERAARVKAEEAARLARGELRAADLAREHTWEIGARGEIQQLARKVETAEQQAARARAEEVGAREALTTSITDRDVVAKDEARFVDREKKRALAVEEEAAEEVFRGGRDR